MTTRDGVEAKASSAYDVVVVGGGLAGICAGLAAAQQGARVLLVEKGDRLGGSWNLSGGVLWTARTFDDYRRVMPNGDPELGRLLTSKFEEVMEWLKAQGVGMAPKQENLLDFGHGYRVTGSPNVLIETLRDRFVALGGEVMLETRVCGLLTDESIVTGVDLRQYGSNTRLACRAVILTSGGFSANSELLSRYMGPWADRLLPRCHSGNTGDGFQMALEAGASASRALSSVYGHLVPAPPARIEPSMFREVTFYASIHTIILNKLGQRFADESVYDATTNQALVYQPEASGFLVFDAASQRHEAEVAGTAHPGALLHEQAELVRQIGGRAETVDSLEEVARVVSGWGAYGAGALETIEQYNEAARAGSAAQLWPARKRYAYPLETPPFTVIAVTASVTFTKGGLRVSPNCEVVDRQGEPIPGLYAAGADAGGVFYEQYAGGGAWGAVSGVTAAARAVSEAGTTSV